MWLVWKKGVLEQIGFLQCKLRICSEVVTHRERDWPFAGSSEVEQ